MSRCVPQQGTWLIHCHTYHMMAAAQLLSIAPTVYSLFNLQSPTPYALRLRLVALSLKLNRKPFHSS